MRCSVSITWSSRDDAVVQPVGDVLAGDAQRGAVLHQADVVDVGHLGAADALVDPAHDVAEDALRVVVELLLDRPRRPVRPRRRPGSAGCRRARRARRAAQLLLPRGHVDLVVVQSRAASPRSATAPRRCWRRPSGGAIFCSSMSAIRSGIAHMPLPICAWPGRPQASPMSTFAVLVGLDPRRAASCRPCGSSGRPPSRCGSRRRCGRGSRC